MPRCENPQGADNQQERSILTPEFLAGLIVGEGSYFIGVRRQKNKAGYYVTMYPGFGLRMNDLETVAAICASFQEYGLYYYNNTAYKGCEGVTVIGLKQMREHLDFFLPLLYGKKLRAAEIVSKFTDSRIANPRERFTDYDVDLLEELREVNGPTRGRMPIEILRDCTRGSYQYSGR